MKRVLLATVFLMVMSFFAQAVRVNGFNIKRKRMPDNWSVGLFMTFSDLGVAQNQDIIIKIYNDNVMVFNRTDESIYVNCAESHISLNGSITNLNNNEQETSEDRYIVIPPKTWNALYDVSGKSDGADGYIGQYSANKTAFSKPLTKEVVDFMGLVDDLRMELESGDMANAGRHFTEDEAIFKIKAIVTYSFSKRATDKRKLTCSTWISDIMLSLYYVNVPVIEKAGGLRPTTAPMLSFEVMTQSPMEYDPDQSPVTAFDIMLDLKHGMFELQPICGYNYEGFYQYKDGSNYERLDNPFQYDLSRNPINWMSE